MKAAKQHAKDEGWIPRISLKKTPKVTVKLISDEKRTITDSAGEKVSGIALKVLHEGEEKEIFTSSMSLISQLIDCKEGETVVIEMKSHKTDQGYRTGFSVTKVE